VKKVSDNKLYWVWLNNIPGIGARRFYKLIEYFESPENLYNASKEEFKHVEKILGHNLMDLLQELRKDEELDKARKIVEQPDMTVLTLLSPEYPPLLKSIYDPPPVLYCKGKPLISDKPAIAIVGSRLSSEYGRRTAAKIAYDLAKAGVTVVSGMARGIDTMAHKGALEVEGGYTIAVLGCGVDYIYPAENATLYHAIFKHGTIISEYPPGTAPTPGNFPARNRIVSGLSYGTVVIEAGLKSGALITVDCALEQGREVYALPGNINSPYSIGTNKLLKEGAKMVTSAKDILEDLRSSFNLRPESSNVTMPSQSAPVLDFFETLVYNALQDEEKGLEELIQITKLPPGQLNGILTLMEIKGIIKQLPGKIFAKQW